MVQGVDNIGICVRDFAGFVAFYQKLGFAKAHENERGAIMLALVQTLSHRSTSSAWNLIWSISSGLSNKLTELVSWQASADAFEK